MNLLPVDKPVVAFLCALLVCASLPACNTSPPSHDGQAVSPPNILIAISDDQSFPYASAYGSTTVSTPHFDRVAREGVLFTNAFVASPGCSPSRAALLTGRYPWQLEHAGTHASYFPEEYVVFPDLLEDAGYAVGYTGKGWGPGDWQASARPRNPAGPVFDERRLEDHPDGISAIDYAANFGDFLAAHDPSQPFYFWYGGQEPHRDFDEGIGLREDKDPADAEVPAFLPDDPVIRSDLLDYSVEIEHFDAHLGRMLAMLEEAGEFDNTIVIVTSDNGMAFPRAKANAYEYGIHVPLAIMWPRSVPAGRTVVDLISLVDLTPTLLEAAGALHPNPAVLSGQSLLPMLQSTQSGLLEPEREAVYAARERHSSSRFNSLSYPQRALRTRNYLYIRNFTPERWPAGAPQKYEADGALGPMHGGYHDIDAAPSLTFLVENRDDPAIDRYFHLAVDHRPAEELFDIVNDPACLVNLIDDPAHATAASQLRERLETYLLDTNDPRILGNGDIFETYPRVSALRAFPEPDWAKEKAPYQPEWLDR